MENACYLDGGGRATLTTTLILNGIYKFKYINYSIIKTTWTRKIMFQINKLYIKNALKSQNLFKIIKYKHK